jgi:hypothetical protein
MFTTPQRGYDEVPVTSMPLTIASQLYAPFATQSQSCVIDTSSCPKTLGYLQTDFQRPPDRLYSRRGHGSAFVEYTLLYRIGAAHRHQVFNVVASAFRRWRCC